MLTSKERATLRGLATSVEPIFQLGKDGLTDTFLTAVSQALDARELIKLTVLKTSPLLPAQAGEAVAKALSAEFVAAIGGKCILYRYNPEKREHVCGDIRR